MTRLTSTRSRGSDYAPGGYDRLVHDWGFSNPHKAESMPLTSATQTYSTTTSGFELFARVVPQSDLVISKMEVVISAVWTGTITLGQLFCYSLDTSTEGATGLLGSTPTDTSMGLTVGAYKNTLSNPVQLIRNVPVWMSCLILASSGTIGSLRAAFTNELLVDITTDTSNGPALSRRTGPGATAGLSSFPTVPPSGSANWGSAKPLIYIAGLE